MSKDMSEETSRAGTASDAPVVQSGGGLSIRGFGVTIIRVVIIGGFLLLWEIASGRWIEPFLISSPSRILSSLFSGFTSGDLIQHTWVTFQEIAIGFPAGAISGIALGYWFGRSRLLAEIFEPIIIALNGIPRTAVAPLFIVWLGIGLWSKVGVVFFIRMSAGIFKTADVFAGIIILMIMVIVMDRIAEMIEKRALRWQTQTEHIQIQA